MARVVDLPDASLSVVMPCYNEVVTIETCLAAVLEQSIVGEVIIVDDGSTDGTREILAGLSDERVRVLLQPHNQGKGAALRTGFAAATLPYVIVMAASTATTAENRWTQSGSMASPRNTASTKRTSTPKPAALLPTARNVVTGVGEPS